MVKIGNSNHIMKSIERKVVLSAVKKVFYTTEGRSKDNYPILEYKQVSRINNTEVFISGTRIAVRSSLLFSHATALILLAFTD
jgi:hypothetical protein